MLLYSNLFEPMEGRGGGRHPAALRPGGLLRSPGPPPPPQLPPGARVGLGEPSYPLPPAAPVYLEQQTWHGGYRERGAGPGPNELGQ